MIRKKKDTSR